MINNKFITAMVVSLLLTVTPLSISSALAADLKAGEKLFKGKCVICHGERGLGGSALKINDPAVLSKTDGAIRKVIAEGGKGMPGYKNSLKPEEIDNLIAFIRSLRNK